MKKAFFVFFAVSILCAQIPQTINFQGKVTDPLGVALDGTYEIRFSLYDSEEGGVFMWAENHTSISVVKGLFDVTLGQYNPIDLPFDTQYWLQLRVELETLTPRIPLTAVGYAFRAAIAESLVGGGGGSSNCWGFIITDGADTTIQTHSLWGISRAGNTLYGNTDSTHINLGVESITGLDGANYKYCTVGGGYLNTADGPHSTVTGGQGNDASASGAAVGGGTSNTADGIGSTVGGGESNEATGEYVTIGGGYDNTASDDRTTIAGGYVNIASLAGATVGGGYTNIADGAYATIAGGWADTASGVAAAVAGGMNNSASGYLAAVGGGRDNKAIGYQSTIPGGSFLKIGDRSFGFRGGIGGNPVAETDVSSESETFHIVDAHFHFNFNNEDADFRIDGISDNVFFIDASQNEVSINYIPDDPAPDSVITIVGGVLHKAEYSTGAGADNWGTQVIVSDATLDGDGTAGNVIKIARQGAATGQVLKWNGATWFPADDDSSAASGFTRLRANGGAWLTDSVTFVEGADITLTQTGDSITISSVGAGGGNWIDEPSLDRIYNDNSATVAERVYVYDAGDVTISDGDLILEGGITRNIWGADGDASYNHYADNGYIGYKFTPNSNMTVTKARALWAGNWYLMDASFTVLAGPINFAIDGVWQTSALPAPVLLSAGNNYWLRMCWDIMYSYPYQSTPPTWDDGTIVDDISSVIQGGGVANCGTNIALVMYRFPAIDMVYELDDGGTDGHIAAASGIRTGSVTLTDYNHFGSAGSPGYANDDVSDVYIEDELEVDGITRLGDALYIDNVPDDAVADSILTIDSGQVKKVSASAVGGGSGFTQLRANGGAWLTDSVTFVEGTDISLTQTGDSITISSSGAGGGAANLQEAYEGGGTILMSDTYGDIRIWNDWSDEMLFLDESTGDVGVGTTSPMYKFHVVGAIATGSALIAPNTSSGGDAELWLSEDDDNTQGMSIAYDGSVNRFFVYGKDGGSTYGPHLTINRDNGYIGLGFGTNATPVNQLDVNGSAVIGDAYASINAAHANGLLVEGDVGIGEINPAEKLDIAGNIATDGYINIRDMVVPAPGNRLYASLGDLYWDGTQLNSIGGFQQLRANGGAWLTDSVTLVEGTNVTLTQTGDSITITGTAVAEWENAGSGDNEYKRPVFAGVGNDNVRAYEETSLRGLYGRSYADATHYALGYAGYYGNDIGGIDRHIGIYGNSGIGTDNVAVAGRFSSGTYGFLGGNIAGNNVGVRGNGEWVAAFFGDYNDSDCGERGVYAIGTIYGVFARDTSGGTTTSENFAYLGYREPTAPNTEYGILACGNDYAGYFNGDVRITGKLFDSSGDEGTSGQVLSSTGGATNWITPTNGDITSVNAGDGLTGGETSGAVDLDVGAGDGINALANSIEVDVTDILGTGLTESSNNININFAGTGSAITVARSDHNHDTRYVRNMNGDDNFRQGHSNTTVGSGTITLVTTHMTTLKFNRDTGNFEFDRNPGASWTYQMIMWRYNNTSSYACTNADPYILTTGWTGTGGFNGIFEFHFGCPINSENEMTHVYGIDSNGKILWNYESYDVNY